MRVAILGCGPAGMFAAHAAAELGSEIAIFSKPRKSFMRGAQYLHRPIPGLTGDPFKVTYDLLGSVEGYRNKVYGDITDIHVDVSPESLVGVADAWDIREAYDEAWSLYGEEVHPYDLNGDSGLDRLKAIQEEYDVVVSTVPAKLLCQDPAHQFISQNVWATDDLKTQGLFLKDDGSLHDNLVVCSGNPDDWWYRQSRIHGWVNTEFPYERKPRLPEDIGIWKVEKPVMSTCTCFPEIVRMGRYGRWQKGVLSDAAFYETTNILMSVGVA